MKKMLLLALLSLMACQKPNENAEESLKYKTEMEAWHQKRVDRLLSPIGWLNVRGLYWLKEGINSFGSGKTNDIVFPEGKIAEKAGFFILQDSVVTMQVLPDVEIVSDDQPVSSMIIFKSDTSRSKELRAGSLQWFVIKRSDKIGVRLRDLEANNLKTFKGIDRFDSDLKWRLKAKLSIQPGKKVEMANVLGQTYLNEVKGTLTFIINDKKYQFDAIDEEGKLFIIFGDLSNDKTTYGSGRYLYAAMPESGDEVILDFNQAINPPCAFTEFATCLLPPKQNILPIEIAAGEKAYHLNTHE
jgi:uncharacterized protein (DUF1684 family)